MAHTTRYGNRYTDQEWDTMQQNFEQEADAGEKWLIANEELVQKAASFLNREFPDVSVRKWAAALDNPQAVQFTDAKKQERFEAAEKWIEAELQKI